MSDFSLKSIDARTIAGAFDYSVNKKAAEKQSDSLQVNNDINKNIGKDEHTKQTTEGETVVGAEGNVARNLIGVTQAGNADGDQDNNSNQQSGNSSTAVANIKDLRSSVSLAKHSTDPVSNKIAQRWEKLLNGADVSEITKVVEKSQNKEELLNSANNIKR